MSLTSPDITKPVPDRAGTNILQFPHLEQQNIQQKIGQNAQQAVPGFPVQDATPAHSIGVPNTPELKAVQAHIVDNHEDLTPSTGVTFGDVSYHTQSSIFGFITGVQGWLRTLKSRFFRRTNEYRIQQKLNEQQKAPVIDRTSYEDQAA